ncbi:PstS family phosphate ABC transporter substrate-binding protein [Nostoc sp. FACHB-152]|uniref:PstS family phosphate ABC transporter substrate-binding protein n=1 Tax=unclassified Nostoc TaxID=2593658 RepID=UPI0016892923|nr:MULTISPECIES: PstS family phosphate ABC transporter substrate-binding protein [unclassified Nostoc]MBD2451343.1 PstS family phosphate ABC transporter substrate-binding protein [Nostoc sp. FACHB-152]MBD2466304.1 PstS family phosphate ABC transporter substrate-binding protein [Nostoc sp. FACHB-145]
MKAKFQKLALALLMLTLFSSCAANTTSTHQSQQSSNAVEASNTATDEKTIKIDGSSTVYPITQAIAKEFQANSNSQSPIDVNFSGTTGGFEKFCAGQTDISNASRPILLAEMETCKKNGVGYIELPIAFDALTVAVNPQNNWAKDITVAELKKIWEPAATSKITRWNQVRATWPDRPLTLYGAGRKSGTFDYFTEAIVGKARASRNDYTASEDDEVLVDRISKDPNALGYFGYAYYEKHQNKLKALSIDNGRSAVLPSRQTVEKAQYQPLSRPLFIYVNPQSLLDRGTLYKFVDFYLKNAPKTVSTVGYIPLPNDGYQINYVHLYKNKVGTVFDGKAEMNLTIGELLRKEAKF